MCGSLIPRNGSSKSTSLTRNYEDRVAYARELRELFEIRSPIVLGGLDETIHLRYGNMPNAVYVVNKEGNIIYKANWTDSPVVDQVLKQLRAEEQAEEERVAVPG